MNSKEGIINEYLVGGINFGTPGENHGISRSTINRRVIGHQGFICMKKIVKRKYYLPETKYRTNCKNLPWRRPVAV